MPKFNCYIAEIKDDKLLFKSVMKDHPLYERFSYIILTFHSNFGDLSENDTAILIMFPNGDIHSFTPDGKTECYLK